MLRACCNNYVNHNGHRDHLYTLTPQYGSITLSVHAFHLMASLKDHMHSEIIVASVIKHTQTAYYIHPSP